MKFIHNIGDYFSSNYFNDEFAKEVVKKTGFSPEDLKVKQKQISNLKDKYFRYKETLLEGRLRVKDKVTDTCQFHCDVLNALGYEGNHTDYQELFHVDDKTVLPVRNTLYRDTQPHLMIMEMHSLVKDGEEEPDGLFEQQYHIDEDETSTTDAQKYHRSQWSNVFHVPEGVKISPMVINKAVSRLFLLDAHRRPKYILLCAGNMYYLLEGEKWFRGSYLEIDLEELFDETSINKDYYSLFYTLLSKETLAPQSEIVLMDQLDEESHKKAYEVTQDLKEGVIHAVQEIANESVRYLKDNGHDLSTIDADILKNECLTYVYRLLFLFYAESRQDLDILPSDDEVYQKGYSLEMLRDLEQTPLNTASSQNGYFFHDSLTKLFQLLSSGYREGDGANKSFKIRHLDSPLFNDSTLQILPKAKLRNVVWQDIICQLSLSKKQKGKSRGRISYANLGINQLGSVYESLLAFRGFFAETDYIEVHRKLKAKEKSESVANKDGSYLVPRHRIDDFDPKEVFHENDGEMRIIQEGTFIYRLSGRDRQKSASYYTPEVLTQCTVKYTLKPILEKLDKGEMNAIELLNLKILEPAMGAAAFHNEVINQLAEAYLQYRQNELLGPSGNRINFRIEPDKYQEELQKVKAYIALRNVYGVDLNPTAVELGKLSLWLNVIHKDMQTPFFGYRLGTGNAVVGSWLKVFTVSAIQGNPAKPKEKKEWWTKAPKHLSFNSKGIVRKDNEIYHFLLPDKGMVPSAGIKLLKDEYPNETKKISDWKKDFCSPLYADEVSRVKLISNKIDSLIEEHYENQKQVARQTQVGLNVFGADELASQASLDLRSYEEKEAIAKQRTNHNAPYFKLKMIMDYWCSLWFWDVRDAKDIPTRNEWYDDLMYILEYQMAGSETVEELKNYRRKEQSEQVTQELADNALSGTLFENNRLKLVKNYAEMYKFFHYQLEFVEVFREQGGFDLIVGNPPWAIINIDKVGLIADFDPICVVRNYDASKRDILLKSLLEQSNEFQSELYANSIQVECFQSFVKSSQNFNLISGQKPNLYKLVLEKTMRLGENIGLVHDKGVYEDLDAGFFRENLYHRLSYYFQFQNEKKLFDVGNAKQFEISILSVPKKDICFQAISNLFHPLTIEECFADVCKKRVLGMRNEDNNWELRGNLDRVVNINFEALQLYSKIFDVLEPKRSPFPNIHSQRLIGVLKQLSSTKNLKSIENQISTSLGLNETNSKKKNVISQSGEYVEKSEFIISAPHYYVANPFFQTPNQGCKSHRDNTQINLNNISKTYLPRTRYKLINQNVDSRMPDYFYVNRERIKSSNERSLISTIYPPRYIHTYTSYSMTFKKRNDLISFASYSSSIVYDFFIRTTGREHILFDVLKNLPFVENPNKYIIHRYLLLTCLSEDFADLWNEFSPKFPEKDCLNIRASHVNLKIFNNKNSTWSEGIPLRNNLYRRQALIEIDVLVAMEMKISLEDLLSIFQIQFPVLKNNDSELKWNVDGLPEENPENRIELDRVEDYKTAWAHFENIFGDER